MGNFAYERSRYEVFKFYRLLLQTVNTQIRLRADIQFDLGKHCLSHFPRDMTFFPTCIKLTVDTTGFNHYIIQSTAV